MSRTDAGSGGAHLDTVLTQTAERLEFRLQAAIWGDPTGPPKGGTQNEEQCQDAPVAVKPYFYYSELPLQQATKQCSQRGHKWVRDE